MEKDRVKSRETEVEELKWMFRLRAIIGTGFFFAGLILWMHKVFLFPIIQFSVGPLGIAFLNQPYPFIIKKTRNLRRLMEFHLIIDVFLISWAIHFLGGMDAFYLCILYALPILFAGYLVSAKAAVWITTLSVMCYAEIIWLERSGIIDFIPVFGLGIDLYLRLGSLLLIILALYLLAYVSSFLGTAVRNREGEIRNAREYIDNIIKSMIDALVVLEPDGKIKTVNQATTNLLGYKEEELIGKPVSLIFTEEKEDAVLLKGAKIWKLLEEGLVRDYSLAYKTKSGDKIPVSFFGSAMRDEEGNSIGIVGIARDMREIKRLMQKEKELRIEAAEAAEAERKKATELEQAYKELEETRDMLIQAEKLNAVGQLASGVAHEVKNPLAMIMQGVNYLEKKFASEKEISDVVKIIKSDTIRADKIVCSLVDFSRVTKLDLQPNDINSVLEGSLLLVQHSFKAEDIGIFKDMRDNLPQVLVDKTKMEQVFINIFLNAVQAMSRGGRLFIRSYSKDTNLADTAAAAKSGAQFRLGEPTVTVEIEDTGSGVSKDNLNKVFDPFFTTKGPRGGAGLGLSVTRNIIDMHKGLIKIESEENKGTKVIITLRIAGAK